MTRSTLHRLTSLISFAAAAVFVGGCVQRRLTVVSDPPGATVTMNEHEIGRTPFTTDFVYYGVYDVQVRKEGYQTINKPQPLHAPWWAVPPLDLLAELMPWHPTDRRTLKFTLTPLQIEDTDTNNLISRASILQLQLESTRVPSTQAAATQPSTQPATQPATTRPATQK